MAGFYEVGPLTEIAINLFYGWGYNFYRKENQLRADDLLVRARVGALLAQARAAVESAESDFRRAFLPPPSRVKPYPDPQAVADAQTLEKFSHDIGALDGQIRAAPVPENDRMTQRTRKETDTLARLVQADQLLTGQADLLRQTLAGQTGPWIIENKPLIAEGLTAIAETLRTRALLLA